MVGRIPVMDVFPVVDLGRRPAKATVGEPFPVRATVFREGHDKLGAEVVATGPAGERRSPLRMAPIEGLVDRYEAWLTPDVEGAWTFEIHAWSDPWATWKHAAGIKIPAGIDVDLMFAEAALLLARVDRDSLKRGERGVLTKAVKAAERPGRATTGDRAAILLSDELTDLMTRHPVRDLLSIEGPYPAYADRKLALVGSWYEFFPRSEGASVDPDTGEVVSGNFATAATRLDAVAALGFDIIYLPPIHPIGEVNRKGPNTAEEPGGATNAKPGDPGSPWAIGSRHGGHDAIHPELGDLADFDAFVARATELGLEVALDLALQAAPDHPWVTAHPEWFTTRADGTIAYAENPPKKYQDIYPVNFDNDPDGIYHEVLRVVLHWMEHGVRVFRVDNPHTKPVAFWERLLAEVRRIDPGVIFLSEAFTRPPMMHALGSVGFHQSYTYFTWRTTRRELEAYFAEVAHSSAHLMRPNFFVNTPDILHASLQYGGPAAFKIRAVLAATGSPSWGVYAGYELFEHVAVKPGSEEYADSEKYQIRIRDWDAAEAEGRSLAPYLTRLNEIRRANPALQQLRNLRVHHTDDEHVMAFSKSAVTDQGRTTVIVVVNVDPHATHETMVHLDPAVLGLPDVFQVHDEISGQDWTWSASNYVRLDPRDEPAHVLTVRSPA
jgi:starch synthase (maltosyl-transferring)